MQIKKYPLPMRIFHWTVSILVIIMLIVGFSLATWLDKSPIKGDIVAVHKSIGLLILTLVFFRLLTRLNYRKVMPVLASTLPFYERWLAKTVHFFLYVFLFVMPLSGYLMVSFNPKSSGVAFFGLQLPVFLPKDAALAKLFWDVHQASAFILLTLVVLHVSGVIKHRFFDKPENDSLAKML